MKYYEDVFLKMPDGKEICNTEKALSILLAKRILFCNTREYIDREYDYKLNEDGSVKKAIPTNKYTIEEETIVLFVNCNDLFYWGCADAESITVDEVPELYRTWKKEGCVDKWCCKKRNMQPQEPIKEQMKKDGKWESWMDKLKIPEPL